MRIKTLFLTRAAIIASLYCVLSLMVASFAYGPIQFRISEALTILPLFFLEAIPGLTIGCLIVNIFSGYALDMVLGTAATLVAAILTRLCRKVYFGVLPPIIVNALVVPLIIVLSMADWSVYWVYVGSIAASQAIVCAGFGTLLYFVLRPTVEKVDVMRPITLKQLFRDEN